MYRLKNSFTILILIAIVSVSCKNSFNNDHSLTVKEYEKMGMPDHTKLWSGQAYLQAFSILNNLKLSDPLSFPRKNSKKSGEVYKCLVNKENLSFANDSSISLRDRAFEIQSFSGIQNTLILKYTDDFKKEQYYNEELIDMYIFGLYVHEKMLELAGEILNSDEEIVMGMKAGLKIVVNGYANTICRILEEQIKSDIYSKKDLDRLSDELSRSLISNLKCLQDADKQKIIFQLQNTIEKTPSGYIKNNYRKLLEKL